VVGWVLEVSDTFSEKIVVCWGVMVAWGGGFGSVFTGLRVWLLWTVLDAGAWALRGGRYGGGFRFSFVGARVWRRLVLSLLMGFAGSWGGRGEHAGGVRVVGWGLGGGWLGRCRWVRFRDRVLSALATVFWARQGLRVVLGFGRVRVGAMRVLVLRGAVACAFVKRWRAFSRVVVWRRARMGCAIWR